MNGLQIGDLVDRYILDVLLGEGGMASVYRAQHAELGTLHALKILHLSSPSVQERMLQEGRIQAGLRHPNIVAVTDVIRVSGAPGLVLEYIDGPSLDELLRHFQPSLPQIDSLARGMLAGVAAAHAKGLIHRDLKPGNVLVSVEDGRVVAKVADFGLAKILDNPSASGPRTASGLAMGTPAFMAPEQLRDAKNVDHRADVFSLGCVLYELVTGVPAFSSESLLDAYEAASSERYRPPRELAPSMPRRMEAAIVGALRADASQRIASCDELLTIWTGDGAEAVPNDAWEPEHLELVRSMGPSARNPINLSNPTFAPSGLPVPAPSPVPVKVAPEEPGVPAPGSRWMLGLAVAAVGVAGIVLVGTGGLLWWMSVSELEPPPPAQLTQVDEPAAVTPPAVHVTAPDTPAQVDPSPKAPVAAPSTHVDAPKVAPPAPTPSQPATAASPSTVSPPKALPAGPTWQVEGVQRALLVSATGERFTPGPVPPGTYTLAVFFDAAKATDATTLTLSGTETRKIRCVAALRKCQ